MPLLISSHLALAVNLNDLKPLPPSRREAIAQKLVEGETCRRNLNSTQIALDECTVSAKPTGAVDIVQYLGWGAVGGAVITTFIFVITHAKFN